MTTSASSTIVLADGDEPERPMEPMGRVLRRFFAMALKFWKEKPRQAWFWTLGVLAMTGLNVLALVATNKWNRYFYDALEKKDAATLWHAVLLFLAIVVATVFTVTGVMVFRMMLQMRWRQWLTDHVAGWWLADQRYYRLNFTAPEQGAPEFRIADDSKQAVEPLVEFALGFLQALVQAVTFAAILWQVAGSYTLQWGETTIVIPAYMALAAVAYAIVVSILAYLTGRPLVPKIDRRAEAEAQFRASMTRRRENAESIALIKGDADELASLRVSYGEVVRRWVSVIRQQAIITTVLSANGAIFGVLPLFLVAPKYLQGDMSLGAVMQVVAAFMTVQAALIWFVDNFVRLAEWFTSVRRVDELVVALIDIDIGTNMSEETSIQMREGQGSEIIIDDLQVAFTNGRVVINDANVVVAKGEKVMIGGESGTGKSTLIRAIAGLWPWGSGSITLPKGASIAFVPQKAYMPRGTLREVLLYPAGVGAVDDAAILAALKRCGLSYMAAKLDLEENWDQVLSGGERQRIAFTRLLLQKPEIIVMDEATSALDENSQASLLSLLNEDLAQSTVLSVGHRPGLEEYHSRKIELHREVAGARMTSRSLRKWKSIFGWRPRA
jgi:putative ATP-binding cassette transporter